MYCSHLHWSLGFGRSKKVWNYKPENSLTSIFQTRQMRKNTWERSGRWTNSPIILIRFLIEIYTGRIYFSRLHKRINPLNYSNYVLVIALSSLFTAFVCLTIFWTACSILCSDERKKPQPKKCSQGNVFASKATCIPNKLAMFLLVTVTPFKVARKMVVFVFHFAKNFIFCRLEDACV